ncbi:MAG: ATP-binding protein [Geminicoccaceae bacterium]
MASAAPSSRLLPGVLLRVLPAAAIVLLVIGFIASVFIEDAFVTQLKAKLAREADVGAQSIATKLETLKTSVRAVASNDLVINGLVDVEARDAYLPLFFSSLQIAGPRGGALISFTDYRGRILASNWKAADYQNAPWLKSVMEGREHLHIATERMVFAVPVVFQDAPEGTIVVEYRRAHVAQLLSFSPGAQAALTRVGKQILFTSDTGFSDVDRADVPNTTGWIKSAGTVPGYEQLKVVVADPSHVALAPVFKLERFMFTALAVALIALTAGIVLTGLLATRPLVRFSTAIKEFGSAEDLDRRIETTGAREFQELARSFNAMLERLNLAVVSNDSLARENAVRRDAQRALRESERRYRDLIEGAARGIYVYRDGALLYANPAFAGLFGFASPREALAEASLTQLLGEDIRAELNRQIERSDGSVSNIIRTELQLERDRGDAIWIEHISKVIEWEGRPAIQGNLTDITDRKRVERLKNEFVSIVSHELRTPLTALVGSLGLVRSGTLGNLPDKVQELIEISQSSAQRLVALVNDILDIEKIEAGSMEFNFEPTESVALVHQSIAETEPFGAKYGVVLHLEEGLGQASVRADGDRLTQVLTNLLSNAVKFSPQGETVIVRLTREGENIRFSVSDRGPGIPTHMHRKIFEKFTQVDGSDSRSKAGTGLGLAICKDIIEAHGGRIRVESDPDMGSTFSFALPEVNVILDMGDIQVAEPAKAVGR